MTTAQAESDARRQRARLLSEIREYEERWHYEGGRRDLRLDLLRGFAAFAMIVDHIGGAHSWLYPITGGNRFVVSAAEAFVFISGVVMGIVYLHVVAKDGVAAAMMKALHRAWELYLVTVGLTLLFAALGWYLDLWWAIGLPADPLRFALEVATLHRTLFLTDIPLMYTLLLLAAPAVILLLSQGRVAYVLALSWGIWTVWQLAPEAISLPWDIAGNTVFFFPAWQALFVTGLVIGWYRQKLEVLVGHLARPALFTLLSLVAVSILGLYVLQLTDLDALQRNSLLANLVFDKADVPIGRVVAFLLLATFAFILTTVFWGPIRAALGWLLLPLGQNSLAAYSLHVLLVALTTKLTATVLLDSDPTLVDTGLQIAGVALVWLIIVIEPGVRRTVAGSWQTFRRHFRDRGDGGLAGGNQLEAHDALR